MNEYENPNELPQEDAHYEVISNPGKPDKNLVKRIRPIELGHDKQRLYAVLLSCPFCFYWHNAYKDHSAIVQPYKIKNLF